MVLTKRDRFLISEAFKAAAYYATPEEWLTDVLNDAGNTVEQSLVCDADKIIEPLEMGVRTQCG